MLSLHGDLHHPGTPPPARARDDSPRYLLFTNECVGLGHLQRSLTLARAIRASDPEGSVLIVTGSQVVPHEPPQAGVDIVKLPGLGRDERGSYRARTLQVAPGSLTAIRSQVATATAASFDPDVVLVDKLPLGLEGELLPTLQLLRRRGRCRTVLGLRDIEDDPEAVRRRWAAHGLTRALRRYYDEVLIYGPESSLDALDCVGWRDRYPSVHHVGYVGTPLPPAPPPHLPTDYLLVTTGGGADGYPVAAAVLDALHVCALPFPTLLVAGPLMPEAEVRALRDRAAGLDVLLESYRPDMAAAVVGARAAVAMAGYNTVSELLRAGTPALLVPRVRPSAEQLIRATRLAEHGLADTLHPDHVTPTRMREALDRLLTRLRPEVSTAAYDGATSAARILTAGHHLAAAAGS